MKYVLLIYQGTTPQADALSEDEYRVISAEYAAVSSAPGVTPGPPLGLPANAVTVRVKDGETLTTDGPFVDAFGAVGGYCVLEADDLDAAIELAARIPAAQRGGAIEIRPSAKYW